MNGARAIFSKEEYLNIENSQNYSDDNDENIKIITHAERDRNLIEDVSAPKNKTSDFNKKSALATNLIAI